MAWDDRFQENAPGDREREAIGDLIAEIDARKKCRDKLIADIAELNAEIDDLELELHNDYGVTG